MQRNLKIAAFVLMLAALYPAPARAGKVALLLEEPYGQFGSMNPTGHAAIYLSDVCAETPVQLRRCEPGETGVVISRYHHLDGYDWIAMPLLPYLYAVDRASQIPDEADPALAMQMRDAYRRKYLMDFVPDDPSRDIPGGDWIQLVGESFDRKIYGFALETRPEQDDALIAILNDRANRSRFNLFFNNCANFSESILNFYFPHSIHRNFIADVGLMTPKQAAHSLEKYARHHSDLEFTTFVIPQLPGTIHRSTPVHGVIESLVETKKYVLPLAILHPVIAGSLVAVYISDGRFHPDAHAESIFDPHEQREPGTADPPKTTMANSPGESVLPRSLDSTTSSTIRTVTFRP
jgi:hypothetical protein